MIDTILFIVFNVLVFVVFGLINYHFGYAKGWQRGFEKADKIIAREILKQVVEFDEIPEGYEIVKSNKILTEYQKSVL